MPRRDGGSPVQRPLFLAVSACASTLLLTACGDGARAVDTRAPSAPGGVTVHAGSATSVHVMWERATDAGGVSGYEVFRDGRRVKSLPAATRMTDVEGLTPATSYVFTVRAVDTAGNASAHSAPARVTTLALAAGDTRPPGRPGALTGRAEGSRAVTLSWDASTDDRGVTAYDVHQAGSRIHSVPGTSTTARITGLRPGTAYTFSVRARDAADNSSPGSASLELTTAGAPDAGPDTAPTGLTAVIRRTTPSAHTVELTWTPPETGAPVREHQLFLDGRLATTIVWGAEPPPGRATYTLTVTDRPGTRHSLKLRARLPDGNWGDFSAQRTVVVGD
ncbi:fibronectin type III domain-containing protein [Streptomyces sp. ICN441]|uniref:fibronectin type III domain-containing protein n=1 Tax=Streptomyces sp. ICN441 TaxID=2558286 RepID=UPI00106ABEE8|nr:fibronectin type III domain-containing protein [Streptomyces sp. ICN441]TFE49831.1 fibronectin type III domain-containing protein [Streptomyces sp. ICN441]